MELIMRDTLGACQGKFVLKIIVSWADSFIVCPRGLVTAWAQKRAHPTFVDFKHNYLKNKLDLLYHQSVVSESICIIVYLTWMFHNLTHALAGLLSPRAALYP